MELLGEYPVNCKTLKLLSLKRVKERSKRGIAIKLFWDMLDWSIVFGPQSYRLTRCKSWITSSGGCERQEELSLEKLPNRLKRLNNGSAYHTKIVRCNWLSGWSWTVQLERAAKKRVSRDIGNQKVLLRKRKLHEERPVDHVNLHCKWREVHKFIREPVCKCKLGARKYGGGLVGF